MASKSSDKDKSVILDIARQKAQSYCGPISRAETCRLSKSKDALDRLLSLFLMRRQIEQGEAAATYLPWARAMISDPENNCRWQAAIVVGMSIESAPDEIWQVVHEHGNSEDEDMRTCMATVLLEHLLECDFDKYFALIRTEVSSGHVRFLDTLPVCHLSQGDAAEKKVSNYLRHARRGRPHTEAT